MSTAAQKKSIKDFKNVTSATDAVATSCLSMHNWNVEIAADYYFNNRHKYPPTSSSSSTKAVDVNKINKLFDAYAARGEEKESITGAGLEALFRDMNIEPSGWLTLAVAQSLKCKAFGEISRKEFVDGYTALGIDSVDKMKGEEKRLSIALAPPAAFREFYRWLFDFVKEETERKTIDVEVALEMWGLVLTPQWKLAGDWLTFCAKQAGISASAPASSSSSSSTSSAPARSSAAHLQALHSSAKLKSVSKDLWEQILDFSREVKPDLSNYDEDSAWPVTIDEFVQWERKKMEADKNNTFKT